MAPDGDQGIDYVCVSKGNFEILLRELLLVKNYRVEVYTKKGQANDWTLEFKGSPGNLIQFENLLFNNTEMVVGSSIISVNMKQTGQQKVLFWLLGVDFFFFYDNFGHFERTNNHFELFFLQTDYRDCVRWTKWANIFSYWIWWQRVLCRIRGDNRITWAKGGFVAISWRWIWAHC